MINLLFLKLLIVPYSYSFNLNYGKKKWFMLISWCLIGSKLLKHLIQNNVKWNDVTTI